MPKNKIPKKNYARNVITLMTGTGLAQALPIAISPILTRIYGPEEFGAFALYMAIVAILSVGVTGRYDLAIMLPKEDKDAVNVLGLSLFLSFFISIILFLLVLIFGDLLAILVDAPQIRNWLYWIPLSTLLIGIYQSLNYWSNRKSHYSRLAISRVSQSTGTAIGQLAGGAAKTGAVGLVGGQLFGQLVSTLVLANLILKDDRKELSKINKKEILIQAKRYNKFPKFLIFAHGLNIASGESAIIFINSFFSSVAAGHYMLTQRVLGAPISLIANAIGDIFRQEASYSYAQTGQCLEIYKNTVKKLFLLSAVPFGIFYFLAPELFVLIFSENWRVAGEYAQILTPMFFLRFITSPLSSMFMVAEKQNLDLAWQIILLISTMSSLFLGYYFNDVVLALTFYMTSYSLLLCANGIMTYRMAKGFL